MMGRGVIDDERERGARSRARLIIRRLERAYPDARIALDFATPLRAAGGHDPGRPVHRRAREPGDAGPCSRGTGRAQDYAGADPAALEGEIRSTGFYRAKTRSLIGMGRALVERHGGVVPRDRDALTALPGVGLKTANVVRGNAFGEPAIAVDTHVFRIAQRLGLARSDDPDRRP